MFKGITDPELLRADISAAAAGYEHLNCAVSILNGGGFERLFFGDISSGEDSRFVLDGAGGLLAGLSTLMLRGDGRLTLDEPVSSHLSPGGVSLPEGLTVRRLLERTSGLPDPLRQSLLADGHALDSDDDRLRAEASALLTGRSYAAQASLLDRCGANPGFAPSPMDEAALHRLVTRIAGEPAEVFHRERIFFPLGIKPVTGVRTDIPGHIRGSRGNPIPFTAPEEADGLYTVTLRDLERLLAAMAGREILTEDGWTAAKDIAASRTLPFGRRSGFMYGLSEAAGWTVLFLFEQESGIGVLIASDRPLPTRREDGAYRRFDLDVLGCVNAQRVFPSHTRVKRLGQRDLHEALALERFPEEYDFSASPAEELAAAAVDSRRRVFSVTDNDVAVGLVSLSIDPDSRRAALETVLVDRRFRHRGFGRIIIGWAIRFARETGAEELTLCVDRRNAPALGLYLSLDFTLRAVYEGAFILGLTL